MSEGKLTHDLRSSQPKRSTISCIQALETTIWWYSIHFGRSNNQTRIFKGGLLIGVKNRHLRASYLYSNDRESRQINSPRLIPSLMSGLEMYRKNSTRSRSLHNLPKWTTNRPESSLEVPRVLAHWEHGNGRGLQIPSTMEVSPTWTPSRDGSLDPDRKLRRQKLADIPSFEDEPRFWDHSLLSQLNAQA
jgi:hypothetical protein